MSLTPVAVLLLNVQRHHLEDQPHKREVARNWSRQIDVAREVGQLITLIQWDGQPDTPSETFGKGWTLHPDFRAETGDLMLRAAGPDAFAGTDLDAQLKARAVRELVLLSLRGDALARATAERAAQLGYAVTMFEEDLA